MSNNVKQRILLESAELMLCHGIKVMTMDELARRIGVSKRTIYEHFEDKDTLLTAILQYYKKQSDSITEKILKESPTVIHAIFYFQNNVQSASFSKIVSRHDEIRRYHPAVYQKEVCHDKTKEIEKLKKIFQLGIKQDVFRKDLDIDITAALFQSSFQQIWEDKNGLRQYFSVEKLYENYLQLFIRGCSNTKGLRVIETICKNKS